MNQRGLHQGAGTAAGRLGRRGVSSSSDCAMPRPAWTLRHFPQLRRDQHVPSHEGSRGQPSEAACTSPIACWPARTSAAGLVVPTVAGGIDIVVHLPTEPDGPEPCATSSRCPAGWKATSSSWSRSTSSAAVSWRVEPKRESLSFQATGDRELPIEPILQGKQLVPP